MISSFAGSIVLMTVTLLGPADAQPPEDPKALAEFLMERNAESMNALGSISYEFTETYEQFPLKNLKPHHDVRRGSFRRNWFGEFLELSWSVGHEDLKGEELGVFAQTDRYVVNLEYAALWTVDAINPASIFHRDDKGEFSKYAQTRMTMYSRRRPHLFAFGPGERPLKEEFLKLSASMKHEATGRRLADPNKPNLFQLEWGYVHAKNGGRATPVYRFILDGDRGYLITRGESIYRPAINLFECDVELAQVEHVWYPKTISYTRFSPIKHPAKQPADMHLSSRSKTTVNEMKVDQKFDDSQFRFVALGMPDGNVICTESKDETGGLVSYYVQGAELINVEDARGTELNEKHDELSQHRIEEQRNRKPITPATQPASR